MNDFKIFEQQLGEKSKFAVIVGGLNSNTPFRAMNEKVVEYCDDIPVCQFVDITLTNPWTRVIIKGIGELPYQNFGIFLKKRERKEKMQQIDYLLYKQQRKETIWK